MSEDIKQPEDIKPFIQALLEPTSVDSFFSETMPVGTMTVEVFDTPGAEAKQILLESIYPFSTLLDIKLALYNKYKRADGAHPDFVFLGRQKFGTKIEPIDYNWSASTSPSDTVLLQDPAEIAKKVLPADSKFVDATGARRDVRRTNMERVTFEDKFGAAVPRLRAYFYGFLKGLVPGPRPVSELDWNGRLYPYFPALTISSDEITPAQRTQGKKLADNLLVRSMFFRRLEQVLNSGQPIYPLTLSGIQYLLLSYTKPTAIPGVEVLFYEVPVNERRPYMRLIPVENTPISKIHMLPNDEPNLEDPRLLAIWSQERNPTPERDFLMVKILLKKLSGNTIPFYSTMRILDDGTADITVEPPKPLKKLDPSTDLATLGSALHDALTPFTHLTTLPKLKKGFFIFGVNLKGVLEEPFTNLSLRQKLPIFAAVFQEIPPAEGIHPMIMLRYKLVSNFNREDRMQLYITQLLTLNPIRGESDLVARIGEVAAEFQISFAEAKEQIAKKLEKGGEVVVVSADTKDYALFNNPGVDIAVYAKHPTYYFHVYRADSVETIRRIITFLSVLFSRPSAEFQVTEEDMRAFSVGDDEIASRSGEKEVAQEEEENNFKSVAEEGEENNFKSVAEEEAAEEAVPFNGDQAYPEYLTDLMLEEGEAEAEEQPAQNVLEEEEEAPIAPAAKAPAPPPAEKPAPLPPASAAVPASGKAKPVVQLKGIDKYFSTRLKEADRKLFDFNKTHPELDKYVTQCASNLMRQPASLSPEQFERMKDEYKEELDSGDIRFYVFPLEKDAKKDPYDADPSKMEYYTLMKYGSSPTEQNYYMCCKFFCVRDEMMVREVEIRGTALRKGHYVKNADGTVRKTKLEANTCPMCEGKVIMNRRFPGVNETILERNVKKSTADGRHLYIRFLKKTNHPDGLYLPCCFLEDQPLRIGDPQFPEPSQESFAARAAADAIGQAPAEDGAVAAPEEIIQRVTISYEETILQARTAYISGSEKSPLDPALRKFKKVRRDKSGAFVEEGDVGKTVENSAPQIGLLPPQLNEYFSQNPTELVSRTGNQKLIPNSKGFLRVGVENRQHPDSFLAAVAPFFRFNSVAEFKDALIDIIQPRLFLGLNFGNLMLEMYDPTWIPRILSQTGQAPSRQELKVWAFTDLKIAKLTQSNEELVKRAFLSYDKFYWWLQSDKTEKHYRHFAHFFSLPGIMNVGIRKYAVSGSAFREFRRPGMMFIVLEVTKSGELKVRCPPYPVSNENFLRTDVGFLLHDPNGNWEPIFYYNNSVLSDDDTNQANFSFSIGQKSTWPPVLEERLKEFRSQCAINTGGLGIFTSSRAINSRKVVPLLRAKNVLSKYEEIVLVGLLRDSYNHVAALVYRNEVGGNIAVPVIEDGISYSYHQDVPERMGGEERPQLTLVLDVPIIFDWDDFTPAPMNQVVRFYKKYVEPNFPELYTMQRSIESEGTGKIEAVQLVNGLYVPAAPAEEGQAPYEFPDKKSPRKIQEMEWAINKRIVVESTTSLEELHKTEELSTKEVTESFEHLRITFSNWLNSAQDGGAFRRDLQDVIVNRELPLFEKRKRIEIMIGPTVEKWITDEDPDAERQVSLLRVDCIGRKKDECSNTCQWVETEDKCLIHTRKEKGESEHMSAAHVLLLRLIEELIRFGNRRREIFDQRVSQLAVLDDPIRIDDQYILPEKSVAWAEMLRAEWSKVAEDEPIYLEEMRRAPTEADQKPLAPITEITAVPKTVETLLGSDDPLTGRLRSYPSPTGKFAPFVTLFNTTAEAVGLGPDAMELTDEILTKLVKKSRLPIVQYDIRTDPPTIFAKQIPRDQDIGYAIFVIGERGPSMLVTDVEAPGLLKRSELPRAFVEFLARSVKKVFVVGF
jgi:hypothetical protein